MPGLMTGIGGSRNPIVVSGISVLIGDEGTESEGTVSRHEVVVTHRRLRKIANPMMCLARFCGRDKE